MSISYSLHLYVHKREDGYIFMISGDKISRSPDTIKGFLALQDKGLPVSLINADKIVARFKGTDYIGITKEKYMYGTTICGKNVNDYISLTDYSESDAVRIIDNAIWEPIEKLELLK